MKKYVFEVSALSDEELAEISGKGINDISEKYGYTLFDMNTDPMRILTVQEELRTCKVMNRCIDTKALKAEAGLDETWTKATVDEDDSKLNYHFMNPETGESRNISFARGEFEDKFVVELEHFFYVCRMKEFFRWEDNDEIQEAARKRNGFIKNLKFYRLDQDFVNALGQVDAEFQKKILAEAPDLEKLRFILWC